MKYVTSASVTALLPNWNEGGDDAKTNLAIMQANAWLSAKHGGRVLPPYSDSVDVPADIAHAGAQLAKLAFNDQLFTGRKEGVVKSKSVQAGSVSSSKTYVDGDAGQPISSDMQFIMALLEPYFIGGFAINTFAIRS